MRILTILAVLGVGALTLPAHADDYAFHDGFYWQGSSAYSRQLVSVPGQYYYNCGRYYQYPSTSYYTYSPVAVVKEKAPVTYNADWKAEVAKVVAQRDDLAAFNKAMTALGYPGSGYASNYADISYPGGATQYGYSYQSVKTAYGDLDLNQLYQASARLATTAQQYGSQATTEHNGLVQTAGDQFARVAEINARASAARSVWKATEPQASTTTTQTVQTQAGQAGTVPPPQADTFVQAVAMPSCAKCHSGTTLKGNFDVTKWAALTPEQKAVVYQRILLPENDDKHMPKGSKLTSEQLRLFLTH